MIRVLKRTKGEVRDKPAPIKRRERLRRADVLAVKRAIDKVDQRERTNAKV
jgi:hypothetical protein